MVKTKRNLLLVILSVVFALTLISFVAAKPVNAEDSVITLKETASVRIDPDGRNGIRFTGYVSEDVELDDDTFAGIIVAKGDVEAPVVTDDVIDVKAERFDPMNDTILGRAFNAVIWDIPQVAYAQDLTARAYVCDAGEYTYSDAVLTRSLAQVASNVIIRDNPVGEDLAVLKGYIDGANPVLSIGETTLVEDGVNTVTLTAGQSATINVEPAGIAFDVYSDNSNSVLAISDNVVTATSYNSRTQTIMIDIGSKTYVVDFAVEKWVDTNLATNVLYDFDEAEYAYAVQKGANDGAGTNTNFTVSDGVLNVSSANYAVTLFELDQPIRLGDIGGFYFKAKYDTKYQWGASGSECSMTIHVNDKNIYLAYTQLSAFKASTGDWFYIPVLACDLIVKQGFTADSIITSLDFMPVGKSAEFAIDEIGVYDAEEDENSAVILSFDDEAYQPLVRKRFQVGTVVMPGDENYPEGIGATTGLLRYESQSHGCPDHIRFAKYIPVDQISKIIIRIYIPGSGKQAVRVYLNETNRFYNGEYVGTTQFSNYWASATKGSFFDAVVDLEDPNYDFSALSGDLHSMNFFLEQGSSTPFFIDYIKVIYK